MSVICLHPVILDLLFPPLSLKSMVVSITARAQRDLYFSSPFIFQKFVNTYRGLRKCQKNLEKEQITGSGPGQENFTKTIDELLANPNEDVQVRKHYCCRAKMLLVLTWMVLHMMQDL